MMTPVDLDTQIGHYPFRSIGRNCQISPFARFYNPGNIEIGDNVRIDDFCIISAGEGGIKIGNNVHVACYTHLIGAGRIELQDFSQVSSGCRIFSSSDDFSGRYLVGPCVDAKDRNVFGAPVTLEKFAVLGSGVVLMPGVVIGEGAALGINSFTKKGIPNYQIWGGNPARYLAEREKPHFFYGEYGHNL